jgi:hypothetical protein
MPLYIQKFEPSYNNEPKRHHRAPRNNLPLADRGVSPETVGFA